MWGWLEESARLFATVALFVLAAGTGGTVWEEVQYRRRERRDIKQLRAAVSEYVESTFRICYHNQRSVGHAEQGTTYAFIPFPTEPYETLLFTGRLPLLSSDVDKDAIIAYLEQAYHLNSMMNRYDLTRASAPQPGHYVMILGEIQRYLGSEMPQLIQVISDSLSLQVTKPTHQNRSGGA